MKTAKLILAVTVLAIGCFASAIASARSQPALLGHNVIAAEAACFGANGNPGVVNPSCSPPNLQYPVWGMPIVWDTPGIYRTVTLRFKMTDTNRLQCVYYGWNTNGTIVQAVSFPYFMASNAFQSVSITVPSIPTGSFGEVRCAMAPNDGSAGYTTVLDLDYAP